MTQKTNIMDGIGLEELLKKALDKITLEELQLSEQEEKLLHTLNTLLVQEIGLLSSCSDLLKDLYFSCPVFGHPPTLFIEGATLYRLYLDKQFYSEPEVDSIDAIIKDLVMKMLHIRYDFIKPVENEIGAEETLPVSMEEQISLIHVYSFTSSNQKKKLFIAFNFLWAALDEAVFVRKLYD